MYVCMYILYVCMYACMHVCVYVCMHVYYILNKNTQGAKKGEANQKQQLSSR